MFRNVILQALGAQPELQPVTGRVRAFRGDVLLLCSDGLSGKLRGEDMLRIVRESGGDLRRACEALVDEANERGGEDNITVVLARLTGDDLVQQRQDEFVRSAAREALAGARGEGFDARVVALRDYVRAHVRNVEFKG